MAAKMHRSEPVLDDVTPAIAEQWERLLDAVKQLEAGLADPACADQVMPRRLWVRTQALLLCAIPAQTRDDLRRKLTAMAVTALQDASDGTGRSRTPEMIGAALQADLDERGYRLDELTAETAH